MCAKPSDVPDGDDAQWSMPWWVRAQELQSRAGGRTLCSHGPCMAVIDRCATASSGLPSSSRTMMVMITTRWGLQTAGLLATTCMGLPRALLTLSLQPPCRLHCTPRRCPDPRAAPPRAAWPGSLCRAPLPVACPWPLRQKPPPSPMPPPPYPSLPSPPSTTRGSRTLPWSASKAPTWSSTADRPGPGPRRTRVGREGASCPGGGGA